MVTKHPKMLGDKWFLRLWFDAIPPSPTGVVLSGYMNPITVSQIHVSLCASESLHMLFQEIRELTVSSQLEDSSFQTRIRKHSLPSSSPTHTHTHHQGQAAPSTAAVELNHYIRHSSHGFLWLCSCVPVTSE